jgi:hypothetical protein
VPPFSGFPVRVSLRSPADRRRLAQLAAHGHTVAMPTRVAGFAPPAVFTARHPDRVRAAARTVATATTTAATAGETGEAG